MYPAYMRGCVCAILGVAGAGMVVCVVLFLITVKAEISEVLNTVGARELSPEHANSLEYPLIQRSSGLFP